MQPNQPESSSPEHQSFAQPAQTPYPSQPLYQPQYSLQPQYPPQQPYMMPPQPKKRNGALIGCSIAGGVGLIFLIILIVTVANLGTSLGNTQKTGTTNTPQATQQQSTPTPETPEIFKVKDVVEVEGWTLTVNSVKTTQGGQYDSLKGGYIFLLVEVSIINNTGENQAFSSLLQFTLKDDEGQRCTETYVSDVPNSPGGNISNKGKLKGTLAYEVPKSKKLFSFEFLPSFGSQHIATWELTV